MVCYYTWYASPTVETLFIFSTNRKSLLSVIQTLDIEKKNVRLKKHQEKLKKILAKSNLKSETFEISPQEHEALKKYLDYIPDDRILLMKFDTNMKALKEFRIFMNDLNNFKIIKKRREKCHQQG